MKPRQFLITAMVLPIGFSSCGKKDQAARAGNPMDIPQAVEVMPITVMTLRETTGLVGTIAANESAELRAEYPGTVEEIRFEEGSIVKKGQVLVKLDTREIQAQLDESRANLALATRTLDRNNRLLKDQAVSEQEVDTAVAVHARLKAMADRLEVQLAKSSITAPFDGIAGARSISVGDYVSPQVAITTVDDLSRLKVEMQVPERYLPLLQQGSSFQLRVASSSQGQETRGEVYFVSPRIDEQTRSAMIKGLVAEPPAFLKPGMFANVTLILREVQDAMVVPETAVLSTPKGTVLIKPAGKPDEMVATFVPVRIGIRVPGWVQVSPVGPPVQPGDRIVSSGVGGLILFPGRKIKPVEPMVKPESPQRTDRNLN